MYLARTKVKSSWGYQLWWALKGLDERLLEQIWSEEELTKDKTSKLLGMVDNEFRSWFNTHLLA